MKIWLLTGEYPPDYGGGIAVYSHHTAQMLSLRGHDLTVFAASEQLAHGWEIEEQATNLRVVRFAANQIPESQALGPWARMSFDAASVLAEFSRKEGGPDVLESQEYLGMAYFPLQRRLALDDYLKNIPILVTAHTPLYICQKYDQALGHRFPGYWIGEMERASLAAADLVVFPSAYLGREIEQELPQVRGRSRVIFNPYLVDGDGEPNRAAQPRHGFLFTAKIQRLKGIESLLAAFSRLWDEGLTESLYLLGDDWFDEVQQRFMSEVLQKKYHRYFDADLLRWEGKQPPRVVKEKLSQVRAMILPSLFENCPYAVLEAMAMGCPVIVSRSGGHAEIVEDGVSGFVFSHDLAGDLERKVRNLLDLSSGRYQDMCSASRSRVQAVSGHDVVAPQKEDALEWVRNRKPPNKSFPFIRGKQRQSAKPGEIGQLFTPGLLSVVIPFYNLGEFLEDTLQSLAQLKDCPLEIIVVDDGSTDLNSLAKLQELKANYSFRLERTKNQGLASARNTGAKLAQGEFLAFLDSDDIIDAAHFYPKAVEILKNYDNVSFVGCWVEYFGEARGYWPTWNPEPPYALVHNPINTSALIYKRDDFLRFGLNDPSFSSIMEDYDSLLSLLQNGIRGVAIPAPYFKYRVRNTSMYHSSTENIKVWTYQRLTCKYESMYKEYFEDVSGIINSNGPGYLYDNPTLWYPTVGFVQELGASHQSATINQELAPASASAQVKQVLHFILKFPLWLIRKIIHRVTK